MPTATLQDETQVASETPEGLSLGAFADTLGFVLRLAQISSFTRVYSHLPDEIPLRLGEYTILLAISENPGVRQGEIADSLRIKWSNMTKIMRSLEQRGYVSRRVAKRDRRSFELELTPLGKSVLTELMPHMMRADRLSRAMLTREENDQLIALLGKVIAGDAPVAGQPEGAKQN